MKPVAALLPVLALVAAPVLGAESRAATLASDPATPILDADAAGIVERYVSPAFAVPGAIVVPATLPGRRTRGRAPAPIAPPPLEASSICFENGVLPPASLTYLMYDDQELCDWGTKSCASSGVVTRFQVAVRTSQLSRTFGGPGTQLGLRLYAGGSGGAPGELGTLVAEVALDSAVGTSPGGAPVTVIIERSFPTPLRIPDGPIAWSYVDKGQRHEVVLVGTGGGSCTTSLRDPFTGTQDCLADYDYPAQAAGHYYWSFSPAAGRGTTYFRLFEEASHPASASAYNHAPNPASYTCDAPRIGVPWVALVDLRTTGHTMAAVFAFDSSAEIPLAGGQWLLIGDSGSGELLGLAPRPGPVAAFVSLVPVDLSIVGLYVGTQAIHFGGVVPFALSNAMDLILGT